MSKIRDTEDRARTLRQTPMRQVYDALLEIWEVVDYNVWYQCGASEILDVINILEAHGLPVGDPNLPVEEAEERQGERP